MAPRWQYCLHRVVIDTSLVNRVARKIWKTPNDGFGRELNRIGFASVSHLTPCFSWVFTTRVEMKTASAVSQI
jgi:hypothetical protein